MYNTDEKMYRVSRLAARGFLNKILISNGRLDFLYSHNFMRHSLFFLSSHLYVLLSQSPNARGVLYKRLCKSIVNLGIVRAIFPRFNLILMAN